MSVHRWVPPQAISDVMPPNTLNVTASLASVVSVSTQHSNARAWIIVSNAGLACRIAENGILQSIAVPRSVFTSLSGVMRYPSRVPMTTFPFHKHEAVGPRAIGIVCANHPNPDFRAVRSQYANQIDDVASPGSLAVR